MSKLELFCSIIFIVSSTIPVSGENSTNPASGQNVKPSDEFRERTSGYHAVILESQQWFCVLGGGFICSGTRITTIATITAAHCLTLPGTLGEYLLVYWRGRNCWSGNRGRTRSKRVHIHPKYHRGRIGGHDIGLIEVVKFQIDECLRRTFQSFRLPESRGNGYFSDLPWYRMTNEQGWLSSVVSGVGASKYSFRDGPPPNYRRPPTNPLSNEEIPKFHWRKVMPFYGVRHRSWVKAFHGDCPRLPEYLQKYIICTTRTENENIQNPKYGGMCFGDGGGPLMDDNGITVGLFSMIVPAKLGLGPIPFYNTCGHHDYQDIFTYVCPYYGWINSVYPTAQFRAPLGCGADKFSNLHVKLLMIITMLINEL